MDSFYSRANFKETLTIWIPTYNRNRELNRLLRQIRELGLSETFRVMISDNGSESLDGFDDISEGSKSIELQKRGCNLSAGANFLRAFENTDSDWIHIMSDDDSFSLEYADIILRCIHNCDNSVAAIKFDTGLFGRQLTGRHSNLKGALNDVKRGDIGDWFNNLLLISGWIFRRDEYLKYLSKAYLGYGTKLSHILPPLASCERDQKSILFSSEQPILFNRANDSGWPRAASWVEMCLGTQLGYGYISASNRDVLHRCLFKGETNRLAAKVLRIRAFYRHAECGISWPQVLLSLSTLSCRLSLLVLVMLPFLLIPVRLWPGKLKKKLGDNGSVDRW
jgi:hypothetical protein